MLFVRALRNELGRTRLGLAVGKSVGRATVRSRMRRMLREAFRLNKQRLPAGLDLLLAPRRGAREAPLEEIGRSLVALAGQAAGKLGSALPHGAHRGDPALRGRPGGPLATLQRT